MEIRTYKTIWANPVFGYIIAFTIGFLYGILNLRGIAVALPYVGLMAFCLLAAFQNNINRVFSLLAYIVYAEIYVRAYGRVIPYLTTEYFLIILLAVLSIRKKHQWQFYSRSFIILIIYCLMEILDMVRAADANTTRGIAIQTVTLTVAVMWGAFNFLTPTVINKLFQHIKYASIFLCGVMAHIGAAKYSLQSSYDTTNGLAPVQLSAYLGFACLLFFWSVMNEKKISYKIILNILLMGFVCSYMLLSFSRGGLYFISILITLYFVLNLTKVRSYFALILIIPLSLGIYLYVTNETGGLIEKRYTLKGASGRDQLVEIGFKLFESEPLAGVGTGNFSHEIEERKLYSEGSGAHNEFVRAAAEHGFLGIVFYWGFFGCLFLEILARTGVQREYALYFFLFFCMVTVHNGLKIAMQPLLMMLCVGTPNVLKINLRKENVPAQIHVATGA